MPPRRRSRYVPDTERTRIDLDPERSRYLEILLALVEYRYLAATDVGEILGVSSSHRRLLTQLYHSKLVGRKDPQTPATRAHVGSPKALYHLLPEGLRQYLLLAGLDPQDEAYDDLRRRVASRAKPKLTETEFVQHAHGVSRFQRTLVRSAQRAGLSVTRFIADRELERRPDGTEIATTFRVSVPRLKYDQRGRRYTLQGSPRPLAIQPDGIFTLKNGRGDERLYLLEVDNARRRIGRLAERALAYWNLVTSPAGKQVLEREFGAPGAFVVFVAPTAKRRDQLRDITRSLPGIPRDAALWFVSQPETLEERQGDQASRTVHVAGDRLFDTTRPVAQRLDGTPSPLCLPAFLT